MKTKTIFKFVRQLSFTECQFSNSSENCHFQNAITEDVLEDYGMTIHSSKIMLRK